MKPDLPYSVRLSVAVMTRNQEAVDGIINELFGTIGGELCEFARGYDFTDLPFVIATMKITANALSGILDDNGRGIVEKLVNHTACVTVDMEELRRQARGESDGEDEKR